ncbi:hypothetical protein PHLGIDRAFT_163936 [Phlebiopsis gigantea 11061_1 CR5-6]|uniref:Uncharacterized protein n=1 Tax=Phlebiopsis gigantea (strain 11061_1 CR5-6) TaxID=745531 RepID=A0A0C3S4V8_PHLG1|nr:hypothetical protein PHLGIDRAFT_163936 [Phlebiopsis gigantea 11061_1 CR5-6]
MPSILNFHLTTQHALHQVQHQWYGGDAARAVCVYATIRGCAHHPRYPEYCVGTT